MDKATVPETPRPTLAKLSPESVKLLQTARNKHATVEVRLHALYAYYFLRYSTRKVAKIFGKDHSTVSRWVKQLEEEGTLTKKDREVALRKFTHQQHDWLYQYYLSNPTTYLDEAAVAFEEHWGISISESHVWTIIHHKGLTRKVLERRVIHIREQEIIKFKKEVEKWCTSPVLLRFLDEVSFDDSGTHRTHGYGHVGIPLRIRGHFNRIKRVSLLCFIGVRGLLESFCTEDTFDRHLFLECCFKFLKSRHCTAWPGPGSVWIMDGARIHCDRKLIAYLRSTGLVIIFLPAYCPFFNPIEFLFGMIKDRMKRQLSGTQMTNKNLLKHVATVMDPFRKYDFRPLFTKCGYGIPGAFDPGCGFPDSLLEKHAETMVARDDDGTDSQGEGVDFEVEE